MTEPPLLQLDAVCKYFGKTAPFSGKFRGVRAVDEVSLSIAAGEAVGLVGESGCGKSTLGRLAVGLHRPTFGAVRFAGQDLSGLSHRQMMPYRRELQMIFQDPYASLNPRMTVRQTVARVLRLHGLPDGRDAVADVLAQCGLSPALMDRYPHEFSGGQRQRVAIARAIAIRPRFVVCDEPVSALDASVQAQVINLLKDLRQRQGLTYLFISHDLSVVRHISTRIVVMYLGHIVEIQDKGDFFREPLHPYSAALLSAIPVANPALQRQRRRIALAGDPGGEESTSCPFYARCPLAKGICRDAVPALTQTAPGRFVACHCRAGQSA